MRPPTLPLGWPLWAAGWCILLAASLSAQDEISTVGRKEAGRPPIFPPGSGDGFSEAPLCPHRKKAATLVPSFTKTTTTVPPHPTTHHPITNPTTPRHNMTTQPQKRTTRHPHHTTTHPHTKTHRPHTTTPTPRPHNHTTTHHPHTTTSTPCPHNHTTTHHPHTTTSTPRPHNHTTTHHPHTTTSAPRPHNHTTAAPHSTAPTNGSTTHPPSNQTTAPATSRPHTATPPPTLAPFIEVGNYVVRNGSAVCLRAQTGLQLQVRYTDGAKQQLWGEFAVRPNHTLVRGTCSDKTALLELNFPEGFIFFTFQKNETQNKFYLSRIRANLTYQFPRATETSFAADNASLHEFEAHLGHSYQCQNRTLALADSFRLHAQNERVQAFELKDGQFGEADVCPLPKRSSILPIMVGVLLALLILIVIIAFLVGRRRAHSGYQTL
uniref:Macrosialin isoform X1 n=2 Tax=Pogona vitticeps TaxID=103695 RepID=A0ABM5EJL3_9SAUR